MGRFGHSELRHNDNDSKQQYSHFFTDGGLLRQNRRTNISSQSGLSHTRCRVVDGLAEPVVSEAFPDATS